MKGTSFPIQSRFRFWKTQALSSLCHFNQQSLQNKAFLCTPAAGGAAVTFLTDDLRFRSIAILLFNNHVPYFIRHNLSFKRIFYTVNFSKDTSLYRAFFKCKVTAFHCTVFKYKVFAVAEGLRSDYLTVD